MTKELKKKYKTNYKKVTAILNEYDLCGLLKSGYPGDEYDCLTNTILVCFNRECTLLEIRKAIIRDLTDHFGCYDDKVLDTELEELLDTMITTIEACINK